MKDKKEKKNKKLTGLKSILSNDEENKKLDKKDFKIIGVLVIIYSILALINLGSFKNPKTYYKFTYSGEDVGFKINGDKQHISKMRYYTGAEVGTFMIMTSNDGYEYHNLKEFTSDSVFSWQDVEVDGDFQYIKFVAEDVGSYIGDVQLYDTYGKKVDVIVTDDQSKALIDELNKVPEQISYKNSMYFDEVYFARSAYEYAHGIEVMEWTHPPLGKLLMALPIFLFGMSTFTFRIMGTIAGIIMIPVIYALGKRLFKNRKWALLAGILMAFDNFHFAHTRMGTVDSFLVLFILLAALFMKDFIDLDKEAPLKEKRKYLLLSGLFIGCSIATKWTGLYAALGLAIIFFTHLFKQYEDKRKTKINYTRASRYALFGLVTLSLIPIIIYYVTTIIKNTTLATGLVFWYYFIVCLLALIIMIIKLLKKDRKLIKIFIACLIGFVLIPIVIYVFSYVLFPNVYNYHNGIKGLINQIRGMYDYHSTLQATHQFESSWFQWPIMYKPVWYYVGYFGGNLKGTIVGIGNPIIWWFGIVAALYTFIRTIIKREDYNFFITAFILCTFVPYIFIDRAMFMYHYFPTLPFIMLAIVSLIKWITEKIKSNSFYIFYTLLVIIIFFVFYPVVSGMITTTEYIDALKWLSSWIF